MKVRNTMKVRKALAALSLVAVLSATAACTADSTTTTSTGTSTSQSSTTSTSDTANVANTAGEGGGGPGGVDVSSVTTEAELIALIKEAYGDAGLDLHRGHQPVQTVLDEVLGISHEELHVRMEEQGQNLATVADDLGVGQDALVDALVASWGPAIDTLLANGTITQAEADAYLEALKEAFTFRVTWDGKAETPTFSGLDA